MAVIHRTVFLGHDLFLFLPDPDWASRVRVRYTKETRIEESTSRRENRYPRYTALRHELTAAFMLAADAAEELQAMLVEMGTPTAGNRVFVGMPLPMDKLSPSDWSDRIHDSEWVVNYDQTGYSIHAKASIPATPARAFLAPLMVGRFAERPTLKLLNRKTVQFTVRLAERSPWDFRIAPAPEAGIGANWPASLVPNWTTRPEDSTSDILIYEQVGDGRVDAVDGQEGVVARSQSFAVGLFKRSEIRTLIGFFYAKQGRVQSFIVPWTHQPGADTPETPHDARVRFAEDSITIEYSTPNVASAGVSLRQLPWEESAVAGETPAQAAECYLYRFWIEVPGGDVEWRFTNWEHSLTYAAETYLGDVNALFRHDRTVQTTDMSDAPVTLSSWIFDGNPLLLIAQRALDVPLKIEILRCDPNNPAGAVIIFKGDVGDVSMQGRKLTAATVILGGLLEMKVPNFYYGSNCNFEFCGVGCGLAPEAWTFAGNIVSASGPDIDVAITSNPPGITPVNGYFARGWVKIGTGINYEIRQIVLSEHLGGSNVRLRLKRSFKNPVGAVTFRPYCTGTRAECEEKFDNYANFGGHPHIGPQNLTIPNREIPTPNASKK